MKNTLKIFILFCFGISLSVHTAVAQKRSLLATEPDVREDHIEEAMKWMDNFINPMHEANYDSLRQAGYAQLRKMNNRPAMKALSSASWVMAGKSIDGMVSGRPSGIAFDPGGNIYLCTTTGGLWKSTNHGANWSSMSNSWNTLNVGGVAVDPENPNVVYVGTGVSDGNYNNSGFIQNLNGIGVYKSVDGGLNWELLDNTNTATTVQMEVNPTDPYLIYRGTATGGLRMSSDSGHSWKTVWSGSSPVSFVIDPKNSAILYAAGNGAIGKSTDSGKTWTSLPSGYPTGQLMVLGMSRVSSDSIYLSTGNGNYNSNTTAEAGSDLALSTDAGQTWNIVSANSNYLGSQAFYANALAVNPNNPAVLAVGGLDIWTSSNSGTSLIHATDWTEVPGSSKFSHADIHILKFNPYTQELFALTDGGVYYSAKGSNGRVWKQDMNADLSTLLCIGGDMEVDPATGEPTYFVVGAQDNGLNQLVVGSGTTNYSSVRGGDGGFMRIAGATASGETIFGTYVQATLYRSENKGQNWDAGGASQYDPENILGDAILNEGAPFYMEYDVSDDGSVVACCGNSNLFLESTGATGPSAFPQVTNTGTTTSRISGNACRVCIASNNSANVYVGTTSGTFYWSTPDNSLDNIGENWTKSTSPTSFGGQVTGITTDPNNADNVYMTVAGTNSKHFYFSSDHGQTWTAPATGLPAVNYRRVAVDNNGVVYMGHDYGVLRSIDTGKTWYPVADGFPMAMVSSMHVRGHYLLASTLGRGMYYVDINQLAPIVTNSVAQGAQNSSVAITSVYPSVVSESAARSNVDYSLQAGGQATIKLYDALGREERVLLNEWAPQGSHELSADLSNIPAGEHYVVLTSAGETVTKSIVVQ